jgi:hypothetical protein
VLVSSDGYCDQQPCDRRERRSQCCWPTVGVSRRRWSRRTREPMWRLSRSDAKGLPTLPRGDSSRLQVGEMVLVPVWTQPDSDMKSAPWAAHTWGSSTTRTSSRPMLPSTRYSGGPRELKGS